MSLSTPRLGAGPAPPPVLTALGASRSQVRTEGPSRPQAGRSLVVVVVDQRGWGSPWTVLNPRREVPIRSEVAGNLGTHLRGLGQRNPADRGWSSSCVYYIEQGIDLMAQRSDTGSMDPRPWFSRML